MTLLIVYPGFGEFNLNHKEELVLKLIKSITGKIDFKIIIFCHSHKQLVSLETNPNIEIVYENGIIGQFLFKHITPKFLKSSPNFLFPLEIQQPYIYSHIMIIMDDIEVFDDFNINFYIQKTSDCDIISPCLSNNSMYSHEYMLQKFGSGITEVKHLELFMYIMKVESYIRYYGTFLDKFVSWVWSIDNMLGTKGFKCLINYNNAVTHHYKGGSRNIKALLESVHNLKKNVVPKRITQFTFNQDIKDQFPLHDYFVLDCDTFIKSEYMSQFNGQESEQVYATWQNSQNKNEIALYLYLYKFGGIWISDNISIKNVNIFNTIINTMNVSSSAKSLVLNNEIIFVRAGDENLYSLVLSNICVRPENICHLSEEILNHLLNKKQL